MTTSKHPTAQIEVVDRWEEPNLKAVSPQSMWWVAWRQHRNQIAVLLGVVAVCAAALVVLRSRIVAVYGDLGCKLFNDDPLDSGGCLDSSGLPVWWNYGLSGWSGLAHSVMLIGPVVLGAFAAAPIFTREFSHGTHVFALTQSVSQRRWFLTKTTVMMMPLLVGLLLLGFLMQFTDRTVDVTAYNALEWSNFFVRGFIPAATGLMTFGVCIAISMYARNIVTVLLVGILVGGAILAGVILVQPHLLKAQRTVIPIADTLGFGPVGGLGYYGPEENTDPAANGSRQDRDAAFLTTGFLDADSNEVQLPNTLLSACFEAADKAGEAAAAAAGLKTELDPTPQVPGDGSSGVTATTPPANDYRNSMEYQNASSAANLDCLNANGIAFQYTDVLPSSALWPLRWAISGILLALTAAFIYLGATRLRRAIAKR